MQFKEFRIRVPWPRIQGDARWKRFLPTPGNAIFTLVMIGLLVAAQSVGALPLGRSPAAPSATSTGTIAYQGRLADAAGAPLTGTYNMIFRLYDAAASGTPLWEEQWTGSNGVRVSDGLFNVMLGSLTTMPQDIITGRNQLFLGITVGTDDEMAPRVQLGSVPFAVQALTVPDGSVTTAKIADGAVGGQKIANNSIEPVDLSLASWGPLARSQGLIVMPEGSVTDNGSGDISFGATLIVMNPMSGTFIRVAQGTYHLDGLGYLYVDLPPSVPEYAVVTPQIGQWIHGARPFAGTNRLLLAQRNGNGAVWFKFGWTAR